MMSYPWIWVVSCIQLKTFGSINISFANIKYVHGIVGNSFSSISILFCTYINLQIVSNIKHHTMISLSDWSNISSSCVVSKLISVIKLTDLLTTGMLYSGAMCTIWCMYFDPGIDSLNFYSICYYACFLKLEISSKCQYLRTCSACSLIILWSY